VGADPLTFIDRKNLKLNRISSQAGVKAQGFSPLLVKIWQMLLTPASFLFAALMLANVFAYLYHMIIARILTPADYGALVTLMSVSYVLDVIMRTVQAWLTRTVSDLRKNNAGQVRLVFQLALRLIVPLAMVVFIIGVISSRWVADFLHMDLSFPVVILGLYAGLHLLEPVPRGILLGLDRLKVASSTVVVEALSRLIVGVLLVLCGLGLNGGMSGYAAGSLISFGLGVFLLRPALAKPAHAEPKKTHLEGIDRYAWMVLLTNIFLMAMATIDQVLVKRYFSPEIAGNYAVTFVLGRVIVMTAISLGMVVFTRSATTQNNNPKEFGFLIKGLLVMGAISLATLIASLAFPALIIRLLAGSQYGLAKSYIGLVVVEMTLFGLIYVLTYYLISIRKMKILYPLLCATLLEIGLLAVFHQSVQQVLGILILIMAGLLVYVSIYTWWVLRSILKQAP
jgi:O-antigen/teichoic acid export membrane protein